MGRFWKAVVIIFLVFCLIAAMPKKGGNAGEQEKRKKARIAANLIQDEVPSIAGPNFSSSNSSSCKVLFALYEWLPSGPFWTST
jgi:hypothetical protein